MSEAGGAGGAGGEWILIGLDPKLAKRQGVPAQVPVPKAEFEALADKGMGIDQIRKWITTFMSTAAPRSANWRTENAKLVKSFDAFMAKGEPWAKAQAAFAKGDFKAAIGALRLLSNLDPDDHAARLNLASALANTGDHPGALKYFEAVAETYADDADYHVALANVHLSMQARDKAIGEFVLALEADGSNQAALDGLKGLGILVAIYEDPRDAASLTYVRSDSVVAHLQSVWSAAPRDAKYWRDQIAYHQMDSRWVVVLAAADSAQAAGIDDDAIGIARVAALRGQSNYGEAAAAARALVERYPSSAPAHVELARALRASGDDDGARAAIDRALSIDPGDLMAIDVRYWPDQRHDIELVQAAMPGLRAHVEAHPENPGALRSLARACLAVGRGDEAFQLFEKAVAVAPKDDELRAEWWGELAKQQRFDDVLKDAAKIEDMKTRDWKLRWNEAEAYSGLGRKMEAHAAFAAINHDESLHVDVRKRAKRAAQSAGGDSPK